MSEQQTTRTPGEIREGLIELQGLANTDPAKELLADAIRELTPTQPPADSEEPSAWVVVKRLGADVGIIHWGDLPDGRSVKLETGTSVAAQLVYAVQIGGPGDDGIYLFADWIDARRFKDAAEAAGNAVGEITEEPVVDALGTDDYIETFTPDQEPVI